MREMCCKQTPVLPPKRWDSDLFRTIAVIPAPTMPIDTRNYATLAGRRKRPSQQFQLFQWNSRRPKASKASSVAPTGS